MTPMQALAMEENHGPPDERLTAIRDRFCEAMYWRCITPDVRAVVTRDERGNVLTRKLVKD